MTPFSHSSQSRRAGGLASMLAIHQSLLCIFDSEANGTCSPCAMRNVHFTFHVVEPQKGASDNAAGYLCDIGYAQDC